MVPQTYADALRQLADQAEATERAQLMLERKMVSLNQCAAPMVNMLCSTTSMFIAKAKDLGTLRLRMLKALCPESTVGRRWQTTAATTTYQ